MSKKHTGEGGLVFSTNRSLNLERTPYEAETPAPGFQDLRVWLERKGGGKCVTVIKGFNGREEDLKQLAGLLKTKCAVGGACKDGDILIQGDHRDKVIQILTGHGYKAKKAGG